MEDITTENLKQLTPLEKITSAIQKAHARCLTFDKIMVSISGGADSDVMLDLLLKAAPKEKLAFVFFDTGIEYAATKEHLDYLEKKYDIVIDRQRADTPVPLGVQKYGLPFLSKDVADKIHRLQIHHFNFANDGEKSYDELIVKYPKCVSALKWWCNQNGARLNIARHYMLKEFLIATPPPIQYQRWLL